MTRAPQRTGAGCTRRHRIPFAGLAVVAVLLAGCTSESERTPPSKPVIEFGEGRIAFNGHWIDFPASRNELASVLGPAWRTKDLASQVTIWDDLGLRAYGNADTGLVSDVELDLEPSDIPWGPHQPFTGTLLLSGQPIGLGSTDDVLRDLGFEKSGADAWWELRSGRYSIHLGRGDAASAGLHWRGPDVHVPGPPLAEGDLYRAVARDYGFPFDEVMTEVEHAGIVSVFRNDVLDGGHHGVLGRSMFACGTMGEVARRRGFKYVVLLAQGQPSDIDGGGRTATTVVGFSQLAEPDFLREFPGRAEAGKSYWVFRADMVIEAFGDWPDGGISSRQDSESEAAR